MENKNLYDKRICVVGMGYVGLTLALTFSDLGFKTIGIEKKEKIVSRLVKGEAHFFEFGMEQILKRELGKGFRFLTTLEESLSDIYIIAVGTPVDFAGKKPDSGQLEGICRQIGKVLKKNDLIILRSTVPPGTTRNFVVPILESLSGLKAGDDFFVAFAPERTIEGNALQELRTLPQVIGGWDSNSANYAADLFKKMTSQIIMVNSLEAAEMVKLANNLCRDVNFAFANELALVCDKFNLDAAEVINAANSGYPRNKIALPSPGVGGYCLTKDPYILTEAAGKFGFEPELVLLARKINEKMPHYVAGQMEKFLRARNKNIKTAKIFILGFAFKGEPATSDIRFAPAIDVLNILKNKGAENIHGYDPVVDRETVSGLGAKFSSPEEGFSGADCVAIMNNHKFFSGMDILSHLDKTNKPALFFDAWRLFSPEKIFKAENIDYGNLGFGSFNV